MKRAELLDKAKEIVAADPEGTYGGTEDSFKLIGEFWSTYINACLAKRGMLASDETYLDLEPYDVALMMDLLKTARLVYADGKHPDSWIDKAGYAACGAESVHTPENPAPQREADDKEAAAIWAHYYATRPKATDEAPSKLDTEVSLIAILGGKSQEEREQYFNDPTWEQVADLRGEGKDEEARALAQKIKDDYLERIMEGTWTTTCD